VVSAGGDASRLASLIEGLVTDGRAVSSVSNRRRIAGNEVRARIVGTSGFATGALIRQMLPDKAHCRLRARRNLARSPDVKRSSPIPVKKFLFDETGAIAADMESHVVARIANNRQMPFAVLRVIADPAHLRLPSAAVRGLKPDGTPDIIAVLKSLGSEPRQLPDLIRVAIAARRAMAGLFRCHRILGPGLGFADLG
jgi:hypothetical protein